MHKRHKPVCENDSNRTAIDSREFVLTRDMKGDEGVESMEMVLQCLSGTRSERSAV